MNIIENTKYRDRFIFLRRQGWKFKDIAKNLNISKTSCYRLSKEYDEIARELATDDAKQFKENYRKAREIQNRMVNLKQKTMEKLIEKAEQEELDFDKCQKAFEKEFSKDVSKDMKDLGNQKLEKRVFKEIYADSKEFQRVIQNVQMMDAFDSKNFQKCSKNVSETIRDMQGKGDPWVEPPPEDREPTRKDAMFMASQIYNSKLKKLFEENGYFILRNWHLKKMTHEKAEKILQNAGFKYDLYYHGGDGDMKDNKNEVLKNPIDFAQQKMEKELARLREKHKEELEGRNSQED